MKFIIEIEINEDENAEQDVRNALIGLAVKAASDVSGEIVSAFPLPLQHQGN